MAWDLSEMFARLGAEAPLDALRHCCMETLRLGRPHGQRAWLDRPGQVIGEHR